jgi:hypothetical protein
MLLSVPKREPTWNVLHREVFTERKRAFAEDALRPWSTFRG